MLPPPPQVQPPPLRSYDYVPPLRHPTETRIGLGLAGTGFNWHGSEEGGATAHLRLRSSEHVTWEFALGAMGGKDEFGIDRHDVPATFGLYLYPWASAFAPYFVAVGGANFVHQELDGSKIDDTQLLGALGGGLELRLGHHFAVGADLRYQWRWRTDRRNDMPSGTITQPSPGMAGTAIVPTLVHVGDEKGAAYNVTATYYF
jgi:hypothetical protein